MSDLLEKFKTFLADKYAPDFFITGVAGTGKTTSLAELMEYCIEANINTVTCAYTHKAVSVLVSKLPRQTDNNHICTLHSFLTKRPTINDKALKIAHVDANIQAGKPNTTQVLFVDEFSMVGEKDYVDIVDIQYNEDGDIQTKVVYIGDPNQLPPVKDMQTIVPGGKYWVELTQIHRQAKDNPLIDTLLQINDFINGAAPVPLKEHESFVRNQNIINLYRACRTTKVILAFTNERVQDINAEIEQKFNPYVGDEVYSPTTRKLYSLEYIDSEADNIVTIKGDLLELDSKYKTLETLHTIEDIKFYTVADDNGNSMQRAAVFGHSTYLQAQQKLAQAAVNANKSIEKKFNCDPKEWAQSNWSHELAKKRSDAWKKYLAFKDCVICLDFKHAMTIHKSQGSTYETVFLDMNDIGKCANTDYKLYLKLLYVGISRASNIVYTN